MDIFQPTDSANNEKDCFEENIKSVAVQSFDEEICVNVNQGPNPSQQKSGTEIGLCQEQPAGSKGNGEIDNEGKLSNFLDFHDGPIDLFNYKPAQSFKKREGPQKQFTYRHIATPIMGPECKDSGIRATSTLVLKRKKLYNFQIVVRNRIFKSVKSRLISINLKLFTVSVLFQYSSTSYILLSERAEVQNFCHVIFISMYTCI